MCFLSRQDVCSRSARWWSRTWNTRWNHNPRLCSFCFVFCILYFKQGRGIPGETTILTDFVRVTWTFPFSGFQRSWKNYYQDALAEICIRMAASNSQHIVHKYLIICLKTSQHEIQTDINLTIIRLAQWSDIRWIQNCMALRFSRKIDWLSRLTCVHLKETAAYLRTR